MALKEAGVSLIAKGYQVYMAALNNINKAQKEAFDARSVKEYNNAVKQTTQTSKAWARVVSRAETEGKKFSKSIGGLSEGVGRFGKAASDASGGIGGLIGELTGLMGTTGGAAGATGGLVTSLIAIAAPAVLAAGAIGAVVLGLKMVVDVAKKAAAAMSSFMKAAGQAAAENEMLGVLLVQVGKNAGYTEEQILAAENALRKTGITIEQSRRALTTLAQANIEWSEATKLARLAQDAATHANIDSSAAFGRLIHGIQTNNRLILRNMGLAVDWTTAQKKLAQELGVTVDQLTSFDIAQARVNAVLVAGERITGSYTAAMKTVGKQTGSMVRLVKDAQDAWGKLMLPIMMTSVELKSTFWVAMRDVGEGLGALAEALGKGRDLLSEYASEIAGVAEKWLQAEGYLKEGQTVIEGIAEWMFEASKEVVRFAVNVVSAGQTVIDVGYVVIDFAKLAKDAFGLVGKFATWVAEAVMTIGKAVLWAAEKMVFLGGMSRALEEGISFDEAVKEFDDAMAAMSLSGETFVQIQVENMALVNEMLPFMAQSYDEWKVSIDATADSLDRGTAALNRQLRVLQMQRDALEASMQVTAAMEGVILKYEKALVSAYQKRAAALAALSESAAEKEMRITEDLADKLVQIEERAADRRAKLRSQYARNQEKLELNYQKKLQQNYERYLLRKQQSQRRFALSERRLAAAGDVLGLIMAREDEALRLKEEEENRDIGLRHDQQNYEARLAEMEAAFKEQMRLLAEETEKQRRAAIDAATQQRLDMQRGLLDQRQLIEDNYQKQLQMAEQAKNDSLITLGRRFQAEGKITEDGLKDIIETINNAYGVEGFADAIYTGFAKRADETLTVLYARQKTQLESIIEMMQYIEEFRELPPTGGGSRAPGGQHPWSPRVPRRMGGEDIVTGPAAILIEPGVTEYVQTIPMPVSQAISVKHSGSFGLTGAGNASPGSVDMALERMVEGFDLALKRLRRR